SRDASCRVALQLHRLAASCPLVEGLYLNDSDSMLQLLCAPSQLRTDILAWICTRYSTLFIFCHTKTTSYTTVVCFFIFLFFFGQLEIAALGQELMLCKSGDLDLIRGNASAHRQLRFLEQLLTLIPSCQKPAGNRTDGEALLNEVFAAENLPNLTQALKPTFYPWPTHINTYAVIILLHALYLLLPCSCDAADERPIHCAASGWLFMISKILLMHWTEKFFSCSPQCDFLIDEDSPAVFSLNALRVAACDLQQLMSTFSHVYETDLRAYCNRDIPHFSKETDIFHRVHQLLLALNKLRSLSVHESESCRIKSPDVAAPHQKPLLTSQSFSSFSKCPLTFRVMVTSLTCVGSSFPVTSFRCCFTSFSRAQMSPSTFRTSVNLRLPLVTSV
uniref:HAUS augmin-like complex, subunit 7 n=1 Tax=Amphiprion percula TaxID=161767 RepID=A0A3P8TJF1_AMPPE